MFVSISLVTCREGADVNHVVQALTEIYAAHHDVRRAEIAHGLRLLEPQWPQASYSVVLEFVDEAAWRRFRVAPAHIAIHEVTKDVVASMVATQYERDGR
jgi:hypothetical protein